MGYFNELLNILNAMSPYLLLGFFVAGVLHVYVPKTTYTKYLSKKGFKSVFLSALFGVPLPLCSCGVIPTAMSLKKEGASDGATVSFLIATPQTGIDSMLATYGVFGAPFAIIRPIVAFIVALFGGSLVDRFSTANELTVKQTNGAQRSGAEQKRPSMVDALKYGFVDMLQDLGLWLTIGLVIAAAITAFVPSDIFVFSREHYFLNILIILLLSVPMYICSTGSIPIALSLMLKGISPGAALIFLMAGPATNVATLAVVKKVLGTRVTALYLLSIILGAVGFAIFIDWCLPREWFTYKLMAIRECAQCGDGVAWWHTASSILFVALFINAYIQRVRTGGHSHEYDETKGAEGSEGSEGSEGAAVAIQRFKVTGMRCNHCRANVEKAIAALPNVDSATVDLTSGMVEVEGNVLSDEVYAVVKQLGFEIAKYD